MGGVDCARAMVNGKIIRTRSCCAALHDRSADRSRDRYTNRCYPVKQSTGHRTVRCTPDMLPLPMSQDSLKIYTNHIPGITENVFIQEELPYIQNLFDVGRVS